VEVKPWGVDVWPDVFGPSTWSPLSRIKLSSSLWIFAPASSTSAKPPEERTKWRIPWSAHSRIAWAVTAAGRIITATSMSRGSAAMEEQTSIPRISPPLGLTGYTLPE